MSQRTERLESEIQAVLGEILSRGAIRDSRVRNAGLITITYVHVSGDLREARAAFTVFGADAAVLERVRQGLEAARAYVQQELGRRLRMRSTPLLKFDVDRSLDNAFRVDSLLREAAAQSRADQLASAAVPESADGAEGTADAGEPDDDDSDDAPPEDNAGAAQPPRCA
jgi:ribosome-binding factor A